MSASGGVVNASPRARRASWSIGTPSQTATAVIGTPQTSDDQHFGKINAVYLDAGKDSPVLVAAYVVECHTLDGVKLDVIAGEACGVPLGIAFPAKLGRVYTGNPDVFTGNKAGPNARLDCDGVAVDGPNDFDLERAGDGRSSRGGIGEGEDQGDDDGIPFHAPIMNLACAGRKKKPGANRANLVPQEELSDDSKPNLASI